MTRFSVVVPTYNRSCSLKRTIDSVLDQRFGDFELLIIDDGSTDDTERTVKEIADARIRYLWMPNSGGPAAPRNRGIAEAIGDWICFLDSDDIWYPTKLEEVNILISSNPELDAVYHGLVYNNGEPRKSPPRAVRKVTPDFYKELLLNGNRCPTSSMSIRRRFLLEHDLKFNESPSFRIVEDYDMWMRLAHHGACFGSIDKRLGEYVIADSNISSDTSKQEKNLLTVLKHHVFEIQQFEVNKRKLWKNVLAGHYAFNAANDFQSGKLVSFIKHASKSTLLSPRYIYARIETAVRNRVGKFQ